MYYCVLLLNVVYCHVLCCIVMYYDVLWCIMVQCGVLLCIVMYCGVLWCIMRCIVMYCGVLTATTSADVEPSTTSQHGGESDDHNSSA